MEFLLLQIHYYSVTNETWEKFFISFKTKEDYEKVCKEKIVIADGDHKIHQRKITCDLYEIEKPLWNIWVTIQLSQNHPLRKALNYK